MQTTVDESTLARKKTRSNHGDTRAAYIARWTAREAMASACIMPAARTALLLTVLIVVYATVGSLLGVLDVSHDVLDNPYFVAFGVLALVVVVVAAFAVAAIAVSNYCVDKMTLCYEQTR